MYMVTEGMLDMQHFFGNEGDIEETSVDETSSISWETLNIIFLCTYKFPLLNNYDIQGLK